MYKPPFRDMMRVRVSDLDGHMIRFLDRKIKLDVVLQGSHWLPGVVMEEETDLEAEEICCAINESGPPPDADCVTVGDHGELGDGRDVKWTAERGPIGMRRPSRDAWLAEPGPKPSRRQAYAWTWHTVARRPPGKRRGYFDIEMRAAKLALALPEALTGKAAERILFRSQSTLTWSGMRRPLADGSIAVSARDSSGPALTCKGRSSPQKYRRSNGKFATIHSTTSAGETPGMRKATA